MADINLKKYGRLLLSILLCQLAGIFGAVFTTPAIPTWYAGLSKPAFSPPNWLFGPIWILLYALMGISLWLVWEKGWKNKEVKIGIGIFSVQLGLNAIWSFLFFGLKYPLYGFVEIIILWLAILIAILKFYKISKPSAYLLIPYIFWVSFAALLNYMIWVLN